MPLQIAWGIVDFVWCVEKKQENTLITEVEAVKVVEHFLEDRLKQLLSDRLGGEGDGGDNSKNLSAFQYETLLEESRLRLAFKLNLKSRITRNFL